MPQFVSLLKRMKSSNAEEFLKHRVVRAIINVFFGLFVVSALLLTVIAITYQPPDPWLEPINVGKMKKFFDSVENATFQTAGSLLLTGEDESVSNSSIANDGFISDADADAAAQKALEKTKENNNSGCEQGDILINCTDPGVLAAIEKANLEKFPETEAFEYKTPVRGGDEMSCDVAWRFRPKKERSRRMYRDYRRYSLFLEPSCSYRVTDVGDWHSGKNAKLQRFRGVDVFNDSVTPAADGKNIAFKDGRYLYYTRGGDYCKGMNQFLWSFLCALGEAQYLNRTLVVDLDFCLSGKDNFPGRGDEVGKDLRLYFDFDHLKETASVIEKGQFIEQWNKWNRKHRQDKIPTRLINDNVKTTSMDLKNEESNIIERNFQEAKEPDSYWYRVCEGETEKVIQRPWHVIWKSKRLMNIVNTICGKLEWDFDSVRVVRGEKAANKELWPNLDRDTSPDAILRKISGKINEQRYVYISTNERKPGFFDKLKEKYYVSVLDDYEELWAPGSEWYNETMALTNGKPVEFDGYMREAVDSEMFFRGKTRIETFGDLTSDCKDGLNSC